MPALRVNQNLVLRPKYQVLSTGVPPGNARGYIGLKPFPPPRLRELAPDPATVRRVVDLPRRLEGHRSEFECVQDVAEVQLGD